MKKYYHITLLLIAILVFFFLSRQAFAEKRQPYLTDTCFLFPSVTPTPTPIDMVFPTPTGIPDTSTLSATPTVATSSGDFTTQSDTSDNGSSNPDATLAHNPVCTIPIKAPDNPVYQRVSPTQISVAWHPSTDTTKFQDIEYGYTQDNLVYGVSLPSSSSQYTINDLASNKTLWAKVCAYNNACQACTPIIDP